jgi:hypothetical protein
VNGVEVTSTGNGQLRILPSDMRLVLDLAASEQEKKRLLNVNASLLPRSASCAAVEHGRIVRYLKGNATTRMGF